VLVADTEDNLAPEDEEQPSPEQEAKPKNTLDDQLNKAVEVLKSRTS
jgi:hypothetical protein